MCYFIIGNLSQSLKYVLIVVENLDFGRVSSQETALTWRISPRSMDDLEKHV